METSASASPRYSSGLVGHALATYVAGVLLVVLLGPLFAWLSILLLAVLATFALWVMVLLMSSAWLALTSPAHRRSALLVVAIVCSLPATTWFGGRTLASAGHHMYVTRWLLPRYERVLRTLDTQPAARDGSFERRHGTTFTVEEGPPRRVAFLQSRFVDNWHAVVHDPSGEVAKARGWAFVDGQQQFTAPPSIRQLFGGDLVSCWRVRDDWYWCSFT